ncbi:come operon protein 4 [Parachaetomium inaequale]|uniref:Come operon protein 4 n=1 Tax=Parachaetomium inaequale TaxID=2588326 RepID=A0AAN6P802_9PEZI|nr:come operon protein 4 [Parachaetomium inaequale]
MTTVTSIGIGNMGAALAATLLASPNPPALTIWNRTADRPLVKSLITQGAHFEPSLAAAIARSTTLLICLLDYPSLTSALTTLSSTTPNPLAGKTIINVTNGTPNQARAMESHLKSLGAAAYFDGGIMVTPQLVGTPASFVILSGETEALFHSSIAGLLKPIGAVQYVSPEVGAASLYDVAALTAMYGMFMGAFTGIALLKKQRLRQVGGEDGEKVLAKPATDAVMMPVLKALVPYVSLLAECVDKEDWMNDLGNPLAMQAAAGKNILQTCEEEGVDGAGVRFISQLMDRGVEEGFGAGGLATVAKYLFK